MQKGSSLALVVVLLGFVSAPLAAQITTTTISGTVTDRSGATVPNAEVVATNVGTNLSRTAKTGSAGEYRIDLLPIGEYQVEIAAQGFKKFLRSGVVLEINRTARVDASMDVGAANESVTVVGDVSLVNTNNAQIGRTVEKKKLTNIAYIFGAAVTLLTKKTGDDTNANSSGGSLMK